MSFSKPIFRDTKLGWYSLHRQHVNSIVRRQAKVVLLGASIVRNLARYPCVWDRHLEPFNAVTCGIGGDRTQHVLWRAENLYLPSSVHVVVIHCGTNNVDANVYTPHDIAHGVISCGVKLKEKSPHLRVIVAGILPMDLTITKRRMKIQQTNEILKKLCCIEEFSYLEQGSHWTKGDGKLNQKLYFKDNLHPNKKGCNMFAQSIVKAIESVLPPTPPAPLSSPPSQPSSPLMSPLRSSLLLSPPPSSPLLSPTGIPTICYFRIKI